MTDLPDAGEPLIVTLGTNVIVPLGTCLEPGASDKLNDIESTDKDFEADALSRGIADTPKILS
jgi:hypothetical protein